MTFCDETSTEDPNQKPWPGFTLYPVFPSQCSPPPLLWLLDWQYEPLPVSQLWAVVLMTAWLAGVSTRLPRTDVSVTRLVFPPHTLIVSLFSQDPILVSFRICMTLFTYLLWHNGVLGVHYVVLKHCIWKDTHNTACVQMKPNGPSIWFHVIFLS